MKSELEVQFKEIDGFPNYLIYEDGRVWSKLGKGQFLKWSINKYGYATVCLSNSRNTLRSSVHRIVAKVFIPNPENKPQVNHLDGNKLNNHRTNLEWNTAKENINHSFNTGLHSQIGEGHRNSKLTNSQVLEIRASTLSETELGEIYNVSRVVINGIKTGKHWKRVGGTTRKAQERLQILTEFQKEEILRYYNDGLPRQEIAILIGVNRQAVCTFIRNSSETPPVVRRVYLKEEAKLEIVRRLKLGEPKKKLSIEFGTGLSVIYKIESEYANKQ
jgi:predicted DNA-binding protein YlxM (UPF0122 family)